MNTAPHEIAQVTAAAHHLGLADERFTRVAARRAFVEMKLCFMRAAADIEGPHAAALREQVRQADEAIELWLMRYDVLDALPVGQARALAHRI